MRIDYDVTEDEYVEASLAAFVPTRVRDVQRRSRRRLIALLLWAGMIAWYLSLVGPLWGRWLASVTRTDLCLTVGRYEWLLPWFLFSLASILVTRAMRRGRRALRIASLIVAIIFLATLGIVVAAELMTSRRLLLGGFGTLRALPWFVVGATLVRFLLRGWFSGAYRKLYAHTPYANGRQSIVFDEHGVRDVQVDVTHEWRWAAFDDARRTQRLLLLTNRNGQAVVLLPTRAIGTPSEVDALLAVCKSRVGTAPIGFALDALPVAQPL